MIFPCNFSKVVFRISGKEFKFSSFKGCLRQCCTVVTARALKTVKPRALQIKKVQFLDWKRVRVIGGKGGDGCISFLHLLHNAMAGPSGGDGGNGGHVVLKVDSNCKSLNLKSMYEGMSGGKGRSKHMTGVNAEHTFVKVPNGTLVKNSDGDTLAELDEPGMQYVAARGGSGGKGNAYFLSNDNRHPRVSELGAEGEDFFLQLELRIMAHAGLVGFPNAGKSTLLRAISRARPKVAAYPFTTLNPHIGIIHYEDYVQIAVADLPGLIPDAHKNHGLGVSFLKHVERCLCLLYVIDASLESPMDQLHALKYELEKYQEGLSTRPYSVIANKVDLPGAKENVLKMQNELELPIIPISAKKGTNIVPFLKHLRSMYDQHGGEKHVW